MGERAGTYCTADDHAADRRWRLATGDESTAQSDGLPDLNCDPKRREEEGNRNETLFY